ncbi:MAG: hypothetical protein HS130_01085 [Deltaproteobacteria bacterium]|nr:hypothetical protein [Deltaproteobacteria bacterium]
MRKLACLLMVFLLAGCMATLSPYLNQSVQEGEERVAGIGDTFFEHSAGQNKTDPMMPMLGEIPVSGEKYDLTILELNQERIGLQYNEFYYQPPHTIGNTTIPGGWMVKQGFNNRFDYAVADKIVRFKGYEFEVLSVENGQIKYRRLK